MTPTGNTDSRNTKRVVAESSKSSPRTSCATLVAASLLRGFSAARFSAVRLSAARFG
jgi:hypothetical protein